MVNIGGFNFLSEQETSTYTKADLLHIAGLDRDINDERGRWIYLPEDPNRKVDRDKVRMWMYRWSDIENRLLEHNQKIIEQCIPPSPNETKAEYRIRFIRGLIFESRFKNWMNKLWDNNKELQYLLKISKNEDRIKNMQEDF